jgi:ribonucleoside-diphosphate reductase alpha chain
VKVKALAGGGTMTIANRSSVRALRALGYMKGDDDAEGANVVGRVLAHVAATGSPEGSELRPEHLPVFDTAFPAGPSGRCLSWRAHVRMVAAVQPWLSGAVSKTCNVSNDATPADIRAIYLEAWRLGLKSVTVFRDGSKGQQPLTAFRPESARAEPAPSAPEPPPSPAPSRRRLPRDCAARRHKFAFGGHEGYIHVGLFPDGTPGEVFVTMSKDGSTVQGLMDALGTMLSIALQYGAPLGVLAEKLAYRTFEPHGPTGNPAVLGRWLEHEFLVASPAAEPPAPDGLTYFALSQPAPAPATGRGSICPRCGSVMRKAGACDQCPNCFLSGGCG